MTLLESIMRDLRELPPAQLVEVSRYVHGLQPKAAERRLAAIRATAGCMSGPEGEEFESAVREMSDQIDTDE